jgi:hypothetical protein
MQIHPLVAEGIATLAGMTFENLPGENFQTGLFARRSRSEMQRAAPHYRSGARFGAEDALEAGPGELHADYFFAFDIGIADVDDTALRREIWLRAARGVGGIRDADVQVRTDGQIKAAEKGGSGAAKIFARSFLFESYAAGIASSNSHRQPDRNSTFRTWPGSDCSHLGHELGPHFC